VDEKNPARHALPAHRARLTSSGMGDLGARWNMLLAPSSGRAGTRQARGGRPAGAWRVPTRAAQPVVD
jgi:hypothetical protein